MASAGLLPGLTPLTRRRLYAFRANRRGWWSLWLFLALFALSLPAEIIANDKPVMVWHDGGLYMPIFSRYAETEFGGEFPTEADYRDPYVRDLIERDGFILWPLVPYSYDTVDLELRTPAPSPPDSRHWLGTDDQGRDMIARLVYGFRIAVLFGLILSALGSVVGVAAGAVQGYFGGLVDLIGQRLIEIWEHMPTLYLLIILSAVITPGFFTLLILLLLFAWTSLVAVVRAEFLKARNFDYVRAARALGVRDRVVMIRHVLPNAMVATITFLPFITVGSIVQLSGLDFLGFGLPPGSPSLGEAVAQARNNSDATWITLSVFATMTVLLSLLLFVGEAVRDAFDPRKTLR